LCLGLCLPVGQGKGKTLTGQGQARGSAAAI
jgi:hypothetical protein